MFFVVAGESIVKLTVVLSFLALFPVSMAAQVSTGIDVLEQNHFAPLQEMATRHEGHLRLGVLTNPVGLDKHGRRTIEILQKDAATAIPGLQVVRLFSAEHGINAAVDHPGIDNSSDPASGLPIVSLYGAKPEQLHPSAEQLSGLDAVVIDLQDVGVRYWTFQTLVGYFLEASAKNNVDIVLLDRPNPIDGVAVQGPLSTPGREGYSCPFSEPLRPGMTMGELAGMFNGERHLDARLTVIKMTGWQRENWYDDTGLLWTNPSPNMRGLTQAMTYPGTGLLEGTNVNVKGPSEPPFVRFGAPWIVGTQLATYLNARRIPGVSFMAVAYTPTGSEPYPYRGQRVEGVEILVNDRKALDAPELGIEAASALWKLYPDKFQVDKVDRLLRNQEVLGQIKAGVDPRQIAASWQGSLNQFKATRSKYLLYR